LVSIVLGTVAEVVMRLFRPMRYAACALALLVASCGGGGGYNDPGPSPGPTPPPAAAGQVNIVGQRGNTSFSPNPVTASSSQTAVWTNADSVVHRIVSNDGTFDTGNIAPGASSAAIAIPAGGANYHCSLHPAMIGAVRSPGGEPPPCTGTYC
jgi:plastocyanin